MKVLCVSFGISCESIPLPCYVTNSSPAVPPPQPVLCEAFYIVLEYGRSAMFMWMFIEGMYLNNLISVAFFQGPPNYSAYYAIGWGE
ncbi:PDF receptor [Portunus trituberculatus]|uniref:PDF receptor n=1 Tax=Portunus trituberculatus TaxID=210409 RepID=A0A5B7J6A8_PORTR|nr:PDF receptor [Portunus trituberculatus]